MTEADDPLMVKTLEARARVPQPQSCQPDPKAPLLYTVKEPDAGFTGPEGAEVGMETEPDEDVPDVPDGEDAPDVEGTLPAKAAFTNSPAPEMGVPFQSAMMEGNAHPETNHAQAVQ